MAFELENLYDENGGRLEVQPAVMYPAVIARIKQVRENGEIPAELGPDENATKAFLKEFKGVTTEALDAALQPASAFEVDETHPMAPILIVAKKVRADALTFAESYFARCLAKSAGKGIRVYYFNDPDFKR